LLAYLDGELAPGELAKSVEESAALQARAQALAGLQQRLAAGLRAARPTPMELGDYALGLLTTAQRMDLERRMAVYPDTREELDGLMRHLDITPSTPVPGFVEQVKVIVAELVRGAAGATPSLAFRDDATPAGAGSGEAQLYRAGDWLITLGVEEDIEQPGRQALTGLLVGYGRQVLTTARLATAGAEAGEPAHSADIDEFGNFAFGGLASGAYDLTIHGRGVELRAAIRV
jgi:hypothetical protein